MKSALWFALFAVALTGIGCKRPADGRGFGAGEIVSDAEGKPRFRVETAVSGLEVPWSIVFTPDGRMLIAERPGRVRVVEGGRLRPEPLATIADVDATGETGLMGLALHPAFATNHLLYLAYAYRGNRKSVGVVRYQETATGLIDPTIIIRDIPAEQLHTGCRLRFGPDRKLYITTGDATIRESAQRLDSLAGKILRLNDDGSIPPDNPFVKQSGARPEIWCYGNCNPQGIDWQPSSNLLFETEHGPSAFDGPGGGDEVNIIERGGNYGWPEIHHLEKRDGMESPLLEYTPAVAPASGMFYRGSLFPEFRDNLFFGCLRGACMVRVVLDGTRVLSQERLLELNYGRIRDIAEGPNGVIYFSTSNRDGRGLPARDDDRILKIVPVD